MSSKTATKTAAKTTKPVAKPTAVKAPAKPVAVRLTEEDKKADPANYILNPNTDKYVKRDTPMGKKLVEAEKTGAEVAKTMTETQRLMLIVKAMADAAGFDDADIKAVLGTEEIQAELPRAFPAAWGGKHKEAHHPDHPKQPSNSFIFFCKAVRPSTKDANPKATPKELISIMSKMWKDTADEDRTEYEELAAADKERYESEMAVFEAEHPEEARSSKSSPGKPTKATAYGMFCDANRQMVKDEHPGWDGRAVTKYLAEKWEELKKDHSAEADKFQVEADEANKDFEVRTKEFFSSPGAKKLSKVEQAKADDPEHYELNVETGRYMLKEGWTKNPDGSFTKKEPKASSPKTSPRRLVPSLPSQLPSRCALPRLRLPRRLWRPRTRARMTIWSWSESVKCVSV